LTAREPWLPPRITIARPPSVCAAAVEADLAAGETPSRVGEGDEHAIHQPPEHTVGEAGEAVLLLDRRRVTEQRGREHQRARGVAADAQHDVGSVAAQDARGLEERGGQPHQSAKHAAQPHAFEAAHLHELEWEAGGGDQPGLEAARRADEHRLAAGRGPDLVGDRDARIEMAARPAARHQHPQRPPLRHPHPSPEVEAAAGWTAAPRRLR
jgi:hypothetical protein